MKRAFGRSAGGFKKNGLSRRYWVRSTKDKNKLKDNLKKTTICIVIVMIILLLKNMNFSYAQKATTGIKSIITKEYNLKEKFTSFKNTIPVIQKSIMRVFNAEGSAGLMSMPVEGEITSGYGIRIHPVFNVERKHEGIDIAAPVGQPVKAAFEGVVIEVRSDENYGNTLVIDHSGGLKTLYGHLGQINVEENQKVTRGEIIGTVGNSGVSTGYHLHFEVWRNDKPVDPVDHLETSLTDM